MKLLQITSFLDKFLRTREIQDSSLNGLQVGGPEEVKRIAFAVDARAAAFERAAELEAQLLIVHHGLFWDKPKRLVGPFYQRVRILIENRIALYAVHLPLDMHPQVGNNAELARIAGLQGASPAGDYHGVPIGIGGIAPRGTTIRNLTEKIERVTGESALRVIDSGRKPRRVVCVSGGAAEMAESLAAEGFDTFITGETSHSFLPVMEELQMNVIFAGHYATETLGLKALARRIERKFKLATSFIALPTAL